MSAEQVNQHAPDDGDRETVQGDPFSVRPLNRMGRVLKRWGGLKLLLVFVPVSPALYLFGAPAVWQFAGALLALLPLAMLMGEATEHLAHRAGAGIGGLLNATFGNAAELIIALALLFAGKDTVVKASLTGSILSNILLVLGASLFAGGLKHKVQHFNKTAASAAATLMVLAAIGLLVPAMFHSLPEVLNLDDPNALDLEHKLSLAVSMTLLATYGLNLVFSLKTHRGFYNGDNDGGNRSGIKVNRDDAQSTWSVGKSLGVLVGATVFIGIVSEILARSIEEAGHQWGLTEVFLGVVVVAIVGNAAEHSSAVMAAIKNKTDLAVGIALGSALQVSLLVAPLLVFASYLRGHPMDLLFTTMEVVAVILGVLSARMVAEDGESNWLEGAMLLMVYVLLAIAFYFLPAQRHPMGLVMS